MAEGKGSGELENPRRMWVGFGLMALSVIVAVVTYSDEETSRAIGAGFAPVLIGLVLAVVFRLIWARGRSARAFEFSGFILCAGITALVASLLSMAGQADEDRDTIDQAFDAIETGADTCPDLALGDLGGGLVVGAPTPAESKRFGIDPDTLATSLGTLAPIADDISAYVVRSGRRVSGIAVVVPFDFSATDEYDSEEEARSAAFAGMREGAADQSGGAEEATIAGLEGFTFRTPVGDYAAATILDCRMLFARAPDAAAAVDMAERLIEAQPPPA